VIARGIAFIVRPPKKNGSSYRFPTLPSSLPSEPGTVHAIANPTHAKVNPCVVGRGHSVIDITYYQNASSVGGTALAAYPEATHCASAHCT
jgi:hypothetical protein